MGSADAVATQRAGALTPAALEAALAGPAPDDPAAADLAARVVAQFGAGDWWLANLELASALAFAGYDFATAWGNGFHSALHGRAILPDSLRWLWRGCPG